MAKALVTRPDFSRFVKADDSLTPRILASSDGEVGTGKTFWWLGAPGPIVIQTLDQGLEGVVEPFTKTKDIYIADYDLGLEPDAVFDQDMAIAVREKWLEDFVQALKVARTIVWDRESDLFGTILSYAEFGDPKTGTPKDWDALKGFERKMIAMAKAKAGLNFGIIRGLRNEWVSKVNPSNGRKGITQSGERIPAGMEEVDALVHINLHHKFENGVFSVSCSKSRGPGAGAVQGETFENCDFKTLACLIFPDSTDADWE